MDDGSVSLQTPGNGGADLISGDSGNEIMSGGAGDDIFTFRLGHGANVITDFKKDKDRICIETGAAGFDDLSIFDTGPDILVTFGDVEILILDERRGRIDEDDFIF